jgi:hypothetical protein
MYVTDRNQRDPDFRRDFYEASPHWDETTTIDHKLERRQLRQFTEEARKGTVRATVPIAAEPLLVRRQILYARRIKEEGIPAAQPPPPFIVKKPKMATKSRATIQRFEVIKRYHDGCYGDYPDLGGKAWSCCGNADENSAGCRRRMSNVKRTLYD